MTDLKPLSIYLDDPQADTWVWRYQKDVNEWYDLLEVKRF